MIETAARGADNGKSDLPRLRLSAPCQVRSRYLSIFRSIQTSLLPILHWKVSAGPLAGSGWWHLTLGGERRLYSRCLGMPCSAAPSHRSRQATESGSAFGTPSSPLPTSVMRDNSRRRRGRGYSLYERGRWTKLSIVLSSSTDMSSPATGQASSRGHGHEKLENLPDCGPTHAGRLCVVRGIEPSPSGRWWEQ